MECDNYRRYQSWRRSTRALFAAKGEVGFFEDWVQGNALFLLDLITAAAYNSCAWKRITFLDISRGHRVVY